MTYLAAATPVKCCLSSASAALLLVSFTAACGSTGDVNGGDGGDGGSVADGEDRGDRRNEADGMGSHDGRISVDGADAGDDHDLADGGDGGRRDASRDGAGTSPLAVDLGTAGNYVILTKTGISTVPTSAVTGDIAVSPAAGTYITGFSLTMDPSNVFSTSKQVTGKVYAADYAAPTPSNLTTAVSDMLTAFADAAGRAPGVTELGAGNIGGMTLPAGVYGWSTGLLIPTDLTLSGSGTDVWIFQIAKKLTMSDAVKITLTGGAVSKNVFWQVAGSVELGTTAHFEGTLLTQTMVALRTGASINGRLLAQTDVSIDDSAVVAPSP
jgi:hypothetical protein